MNLPETLEQSPRIALYIEEMKAVLERERPARERYYAEIGDTIKAEFINGEIIVTPPLRLDNEVGLRRFGLTRGRGVCGTDRCPVRPAEKSRSIEGDPACLSVVSRGISAKR